MSSDWIGPGGKPDGDSMVVTESDRKVKQPKLYSVLLHNDHYTTMEFVVMILMDVFHHSEAKAIEVMLAVHHRGRGVAGVYSHEIAETKVAKVTELAREYEFPLRCTMEPV